MVVGKTSRLHRVHRTSHLPRAPSPAGEGPEAFARRRTHILGSQIQGKKQLWEFDLSLARTELLWGAPRALPAVSNPASLLYLRKGQEEFQGFFF